MKTANQVAREVASSLGMCGYDHDGACCKETVESDAKIIETAITQARAAGRAEGLKNAAGIAGQVANRLGRGDGCCDEKRGVRVLGPLAVAECITIQIRELIKGEG